MPVTTYKVGKNSRAQVGGTYMNFVDTNWTTEVGTDDVTNAESAGYAENEPTIFRSNFSGTLVYKGAAPPSLVIGTEVVVNFYLGANLRHAGPYILTSVGDQSATTGGFRVQVSGVSNGVFYNYTPA